MNMQITNRDLLRRYKELKAKLRTGEVEEIMIPQEDGSVLRIIMDKPKTPFQRMMEKVKEYKLSGIKRPEEDII